MNANDIIISPILSEKTNAIRESEVKKYILKRVLTSIGTLLAIILVLFILMHLMPLGRIHLHDICFLQLYNLMHMELNF